MLTIEIKEPVRVHWITGDESLHRLNGPSYTSWHESGQKYVEVYWVNGKVHRLNGPAYTRWHENGQKGVEEYWENGVRIKC